MMLNSFFILDMINIQQESSVLIESEKTIYPSNYCSDNAAIKEKCF